METEVRRTGEKILLSPSWRPPGAILANAILAGNELTYRSTGLLAPYGAWKAPTCRWESATVGTREEKSLIPCMTAVAIRYLMIGGFYRRGKRKKVKSNAD